MNRKTCAGVFVLLWVCGIAFADRGWITPRPLPPPPPVDDDVAPAPDDSDVSPTPPDDVTPPPPPKPDTDWKPGPYRAEPVKVEEPNQKAVIAWNGREEILVLSTDLKTSRQTKLLEVMPFPGEPQVDKGDVELFDKAVKLLKSKNRIRVGGRLLGAAPSGEITLEKKIGAHHISVAHVLDEKGFIAWVEEYLKTKLGPDTRPLINDTTREVIGEYLRDGFKYFSFDIIDASSELATNDAIRYRFPTKYLYFPLRISRSGGVGDTKIQLAVLSSSLLNHYRGLSSDAIQARYKPATLSAGELRELNGEIAELFGDQPAQLRLWEIEGPLAGFRGDLQVSDRPLPGPSESDQADVPTPTPETPADPGSLTPVTVTGWVVHKDSTSRTGYRGLENVRQVWRPKDDAAQRRRETHTGKAGSYTLSLPPGEYLVDLELPAKWEKMTDQPVTVEEGMKANFFTVKELVREKVTVRGDVVSRSQADPNRFVGVPGARVDWSYRSETGQLVRLRPMPTDAAGSFSLELYPSSQPYRVSASAEGFSDSRQLEVTVRGGMRDVELELARLPQPLKPDPKPDPVPVPVPNVPLTVVAFDGVQPVPTATVRLNHQALGAVPGGLTDKTGSFRTELPPGQVFIQVSKAGYEQGLGAALLRENMVVAKVQMKQAGVQVTFQVTQDGQALAGEPRTRWCIAGWVPRNWRNPNPRS